MLESDIVQHKGRMLGIVVLSVGVAVAVVTVLLVIHSRSERASVVGSRNSDDVSFLDDYAEELGLAMIRSRGPEPEAFARQVDGEGRDVETLEVSGSGNGDGAVVVLRLRRERTEYEWLGEGEPYEISACYKWVLGIGINDYMPERLGECPDGSVIDLGPPPVEPALPDGTADRIQAELKTLATGGSITEDAAAKAVRSAYTELEHNALDVEGTQAEEILSGDEILAGNDWVVTVDGAIGIAIGQGKECVLARVVADEVAAWHPPQISLEPGEIGCSASWAARGGEL